MNIILFGPPGVGKSTLIGILKTQGKRAIDLEDLWPSKIRFQMPNYLAHGDSTFIGAADLNPSRSYPGAKKILLFMPQDQYDARRAQRDDKVPGKSSQKQHLIDDWTQGVHYDRVIDASGTPDRTASLLLSYLREVEK